MVYACANSSYQVYMVLKNEGGTGWAPRFYRASKSPRHYKINRSRHLYEFEFESNMSQCFQEKIK